ncbi:MAG: hypothetical protein B6241_13560 [Spirochaetaceae bacterium 4572_59]|nr:MAG: hypothetical protein B6241_13560 [Spirochaetaceae bacterium 4572_59]
MKTLVLIRHAKSDWKHQGLSDFDRPLNKMGMRDAPFMAGKIQEAGIKPDLIISSPANRALTTAGFMADHFDIPFGDIRQIPSLYLGSPRDLLSAVNNTADSVETLFLLAHNPGISFLASMLNNAGLSMPPCTAVILKLNQGWKTLHVEEYSILKTKDFN